MQVVKKTFSDSSPSIARRFSRNNNNNNKNKNNNNNNNNNNKNNNKQTNKLMKVAPRSINTKSMMHLCVVGIPRLQYLARTILSLRKIFEKL